MNKFKISQNTAFERLYDASFFVKFSSDDNLINMNKTSEIGNYLFCYGSNSINQLKKRLNLKQIDVKKAYLPDYVRIFSGHSNKWNGGTASIIPNKENHYVKGTIVFLKESEFKKLDKFEGAHKNLNPFSKKDNVYRRNYITVKDSNDNDIYCVTYIKNNHSWMSYPSDEYLEAIKTNMKKYWPELDASNQLFVYDNNLLLKGTYP